MSNEKLRNEYIKKLEELSNISEKLLQFYDGEDNFIAEVENMNMHIDCCKLILENTK